LAGTPSVPANVAFKSKADIDRPALAGPISAASRSNKNAPIHLTLLTAP
jgi:hypothetical protein